jgi:hypothetical protein
MKGEGILLAGYGPGIIRRAIVYDNNLDPVGGEGLSF